MAHIDIDSAMALSIVPFRTVPGPRIPNTLLPRAQVALRGNTDYAQVISGDTAGIRCTGSLPTGYAYALQDMYISIGTTSGSSLSPIEERGFAQLTNVFRDGEAWTGTIEARGAGFHEFGGAALGVQQWSPFYPPKGYLFNQEGDAIAVDLRLWKVGTGTLSAGTVLSSCVMMQYDIEQVLDAGVNAASFVLQR